MAKLYVKLNIQRFAVKHTQSLTETSYDIATNTSQVRYLVQLTTTNDSHNDNNITTTYYIDGAQYTSVHKLPKKSTTTIIDHTVTITHNADGTKSVSASFSCPTKISAGTITDSISTTLTTIPRKTSIGNHSGTIGSTMGISFSPASSSFRHTLTYAFGNVSGTLLSSSSDTYVSWTPPDSLYAQIPNDTSGTGTLTLYTYSSDGTHIGTTTATLTLYANQSNCSPVATGTNSLIDVNSATKALTGNESILIKGYSTGKVTFNAQIRNYASIKSITLNGSSISYTSSKSSATTTISATVQINNISSQSVTIVLTDTRGYSLTKTISASSLVNYVTLTINADFKRVTQTGGKVKLVANGNYFNGNFGNVSNNLTLLWAVKLKGSSSYTTGETDITPTISGNTYSINKVVDNPLSEDGLFDYLKAYDFIVYYKDKLVNTNVTDSISKGQGDLEVYNGAIFMAGTVLFYDDEKYTQNSDGSFSKK